MTPCERFDDSWQVVVCDDDGNIVGAGVLLGQRQVITCAHVVEKAGKNAGAGGVGARLLVESVQCEPPWKRSAQVMPGCWVPAGDTPLGDLALLKLDSPVSCHKGARLRRAPVRDIKVWARGFPDGDKIGTSAKGRLAGATNDGKWVEIHPDADSRGQWARGFSGAGVAEDNTSGDIIGIVMAVRGANPAAAAYMMPVETIIGYLPQVSSFAVGGSTSDPIFSIHSDRLADAAVSGAAPPFEAAADVALRREIGRLFTAVWSGTAVITGGDPEDGSPWLALLVATADPAAVRRRLSGATIPKAPPGAVLEVGAIDLAIDAGGHDIDSIRHRIAERFQFPDGDCAELVERLLHHEPRPTLVIDRVDSAEDADGLMAGLVAPLAARARRRGLRIVLGFAAPPPDWLRHEISLGPQPVTGAAGEPSGSFDTGEVRRLIAELAVAEEELATRYAHVSARVAGTPVPSPGIAPWLRVRYEAATSGQPTAELALIGGRARTALADTDRRAVRLRELDRAHADLGAALRLYHKRAVQRFGPEDRELDKLYEPANTALRSGPCDLAAVQAAVHAYMDAVTGRGTGHDHL